MSTEAANQYKLNYKKWFLEIMHTVKFTSSIQREFFEIYKTFWTHTTEHWTGVSIYKV